MKLINLANDIYYWRIFKADDGGIFGHAIGLDDGVVQPLSSVDVNTKGHEYVQMEIKWIPEQYRSGILKDITVLAGLNTVTVAASADRTYPSNSDLLFTQQTLVVLNSDLKALIGLPVTDNSAVDPKSPIQVDAGAIVSVLTSIIGGAAVAWGQPSGLLGSATAVSGLVGVIMSSFQQAADPPSLTLPSISDEVAKLFDHAIAREKANTIRATAAVFDQYVRKSRTLAANKPETELKGLQLSDYDTKKFYDFLDDTLSLNNDFVADMKFLQDNAAVRSDVIPDFLIGILLHLRFSVIELWHRKQAGALTSDDIEIVTELANSYVDDLKTSENAFTERRAEILNLYPLLNGQTAKSWEANPDTGASVVLAKPRPDPDYAYKLFEGITTKLLRGDRWSMYKTNKWVIALIEDLQRAKKNIPATGA